MDHVFIISMTDVLGRFYDFLGFIWGWLVAGGFLRLGVEAMKFLAFYYAKKSLDHGEPQKLAVHLQHSMHNHKTLLPSNCTEGLCGSQTT